MIWHRPLLVNEKLYLLCLLSWVLVWLYAILYRSPGVNNLAIFVKGLTIFWVVWQLSVPDTKSGATLDFLRGLTIDAVLSGWLYLWWWFVFVWLGIENTQSELISQSPKIYCETHLMLNNLITFQVCKKDFFLLERAIKRLTLAQRTPKLLSICWQKMVT